jgi:hypothetical protein
VQRETSISANAFDFFNESFMKQSDDDDLNIGSKVLLYDVPSITAFVTNTRDNYYGISGPASLDKWTQFKDYDQVPGFIPDIDLYLQPLKGNDNYIEQYSITKTTLGPFERDDEIVKLLL